MQPSMSGELSGVVFYAKDIDRMAAFYAGVLDLEFVERTDDYVVLSGRTGEVSVVAMPAEIAETLEIEEPPRLREETPVKPAFRVASLADVLVRSEAHGGGANQLSTAWDFRGLRHLDGFDPEGNVLQFVQVVDPVVPDA